MTIGVVVGHVQHVIAAGKNIGAVIQPLQDGNGVLEKELCEDVKEFMEVVTYLVSETRLVVGVIEGELSWIPLLRVLCSYSLDYNMKRYTH